MQAVAYKIQAWVFTNTFGNPFCKSFSVMIFNIWKGLHLSPDIRKLRHLIHSSFKSLVKSLRYISCFLVSDACRLRSRRGGNKMEAGVEVLLDPILLSKSVTNKSMIDRNVLIRKSSLTRKIVAGSVLSSVIFVGRCWVSLKYAMSNKDAAVSQNKLKLFRFS